ncbi:Hsp70 protein-domain-containing protein [Panaeolus papilionaceus]|nr:Hsp70 protein-domain-containing protein [Panaeolus papilionaceus]
MPPRRQNGASTNVSTRQATPAPEDVTPKEINSLPPVIGINFGNSYASIGAFTKENVVECIANEDGERQIACAISFHNEELYIGSQAKAQLVKNAPNTITGFRNLLGKKFSSLPKEVTEATTSCRPIPFPGQPETIGYAVSVLASAPSHLATPNPSVPPSAVASAAPSNAPTPRPSSPSQNFETRYLTVREVTAIFLRSLIKSAEDFLGKTIEGIVVTVPATFTEEAKDELESAAKDIGVRVLQLLDEAGAAAGVTTSEAWTAVGAGTEEEQAAQLSLTPDRTQLVVDLGSSSLSLHLLSIRQGLAYVLAHSSTSNVGSQAIDDKLIAFFATDFTKKTRIALSVSAPSSGKLLPNQEVQDARAEAKLRLAIEHTKRTLSASPGAATCSVESLKEGVDFNGSINRLRFDMIAAPVYAAVAAEVTKLLTSGNTALDAHQIDEIVYVGGSTALPGLDERLLLECGFREDIATPFARGVVVGGGVGEPTTVLARGCAIQAGCLWALVGSSSKEDAELLESFARHPETKAAKILDVRATTRTIGVVFPGAVAGADEDSIEKQVGGVYVPLILHETALPARRAVSLDVQVAEGSSAKVVAEIWEVEEGIKVEKVVVPRDEDEEDEEEEEEEETVKKATVTKKTLLGVIEFAPKLAIKTAKGKGAASSRTQGKAYTRVQVKGVVGVDGKVDVEVEEVGGSSDVQGAKGSVSVPAL